MAAEAIFHDPCPVSAAGAELGHFFQNVGEGVEEEAQARSEGIHRHAAVHAGLHVGDAVGDGEGHLLGRRGTGFTDMIAADADGVPFGNVLVAVFDEVHREPHAGFGGIDVLAAADDFLQNVVLDRAAHLVEGHPLFLGDGQVHGQQHRGRGVDGHRGGDFVEGDLVEQAPACRPLNRWPRPPCPLHPWTGGGRCRNRPGWGDRRPRSSPSGPVPTGSGSARCFPWRCRIRRTGAWSRSGRGTWWAAHRG